MRESLPHNAIYGHVGAGTRKEFMVDGGNGGVSVSTARKGTRGKAAFEPVQPA